MPITREETIWLYRLVLGREPESEAVIEWSMSFYHDVQFARKALMNSGEFQSEILPPVVYRPPTPVSALLNGKPTLALACIVRNEARNIEHMLRSCIPVVDFVIVVDTGSEDGTKFLARNLLQNDGVEYVITDVEFLNFSQARNAALDLVPDYIDWTLMLDADEHLVEEDYEKLPALLREDVDAWSLPRYNFVEPGKIEPVSSYPDYQVRLLRNRRDPPLRFTSSVHESITQACAIARAPANTTRFDGTAGGPHIHHMGQHGLSEEELAQKAKLYARLMNQRGD